jgi:nuclear transport factor 2 (NTF2) superfamily protein
MAKPIKPPFNEETARAKVKTAQDAWNTRNPELVAQAYTPDSQWTSNNRILKTQMGKRTGLSSDEGTLVLYRKSHFCKI